MSRRNGREAVVATLEDLMVKLVAEEIEFDEFAKRLEAVAKEHPWIVTECDISTNVYLLEGIRAKVLKISPVPGVKVPFKLKLAA